MTMKKVIKKWNSRVRFPWTMLKLGEAGLDPRSTIITVAEELAQTSDYSLGINHIVDEISYSAMVLKNIG